MFLFKSDLKNFKIVDISFSMVRCVKVFSTKIDFAFEMSARVLFFRFMTYLLIFLEKKPTKNRFKKLHKN